MAKKSRKIRWRALPEVSTANEHEQSNATATLDEHYRPKPGALRIASSAGYRLRNNAGGNPRFDMEHRWSSSAHSKKSNSAASSTSIDDTTTPPAEEDIKVLDEDDEYTKIITPRQDVLFKKGYLNKKRVPDTTSTEEKCQEIMEGDLTYLMEVATVEGGTGPFFCPPPPPPPPGSFVDASGMIFVGGGTYEVFDPYTGNVTMVIGPAPPPVFKPVPLQPVQWFNPTPEWCCTTQTFPALNQNNPQNFPTDESSQTGNAENSQDSVPIETEAEQQNGEHSQPPPEVANGVIPPPPIFQPQYAVYPSFMFGAPVYNVDGINVQYCLPQNAHGENVDGGKRRKKKKKQRRIRGEEGVEQNVESPTEEQCVPPVVSGIEYLAKGQAYDSSQPQPLYVAKYTEEEYIASTAVLPYPAYDPYVNPPFQSSELPLNSDYNEQVNGSAETKNEENEKSDIETGSTSSYAGKSKVELNVHCKPFLSKENRFGNSHDKNEMSEVGSNSSNSDSGISSPSDTSHVKELCEKEQFSGNTKQNNAGSSNTSGKQNKKSKSRKAKDKKQGTYVITSIVDDFVKPSRLKGENKQNKKVHFDTTTHVTHVEKNEPVATTSAQRRRNRRAKKHANEQPNTKNCKPKNSNNTQKNRKGNEKSQKGKKGTMPNNQKLVESTERNLDTDSNHQNAPTSSKTGSKCINEELSDSEISTQVKTEQVFEHSETVISEQLYIEHEQVVEQKTECSVSSSVDEQNPVLDIVQDPQEEKPVAPPRRKRSSQKLAQEVADQVVSEIVEEAVQRVCLKSQSPITEAVTKWITEQGGLPIGQSDDIDTDDDDDEFSDDDTDETKFDAPSEAKTVSEIPDVRATGCTIS